MWLGESHERKLGGVQHGIVPGRTEKHAVD